MVILRKKNSKLLRRLFLAPKIKTKNKRFLRIFGKILLKKNLKRLFEKRIKRRIRPFSISRGRRRRYRGYRNYLRHRFFKRRSIRRARRRLFKNFFLIVLRKKKIRRLILKRKKKVVYIRNFRLKRIFRRVYRKYFMKRYVLRLAKCTLQSLNLQKRYYLTRRGLRRELLWSRVLKRGFKRFYRFLILKKRQSRLKGSHYRIMLKYYKKKGLRKVLWEGIFYARLKKRLAKYRRVFKSKDKSKKLIRKTTKEREEKLLLLNLLVHSLITRGKKKLSLKIFTHFLSLLKFRFKTDFFSKYEESLEKIRPLVNYKTMYIGGKKYKIPVIMPISKSYAAAIRWLINASYSREFFPISLANNVFSSVRNEGALIKQRKEFHLLSFENKTYIRFLRFLKSGF